MLRPIYCIKAQRQSLSRRVQMAKLPQHEMDVSAGYLIDVQIKTVVEVFCTDK